MVKKLVMIVITLSLLFAGTVFATSNVAFAQNEELPNPGLTPDSPFYFLEVWGEGIGNFFTFGPQAKAERFAGLAEERIAEAKAVVERGRPAAAERALTRYQSHLENALARAEEAKEQGLDVEEVMAKVSEATLKHQSVLADVYEKVPEEAKAAIERAMEAGMRGHQEALNAISGEKREEMMEKMEEVRGGVEKKLKKLREKAPGIPELPEIPEIEEPEIPERPEGPEVETEEVPGKPETPGGGGRPDR